MTRNLYCFCWGCCCYCAFVPEKDTKLADDTPLAFAAKWPFKRSKKENCWITIRATAVPRDLNVEHSFWGYSCNICSVEGYARCKDLIDVQWFGATIVLLFWFFMFTHFIFCVYWLLLFTFSANDIHCSHYNHKYSS